MLCKEIIQIIEMTYPKHAALEWDNVGLLVGRTEKEVKRVYIALDATDEVIDEAIACGADMLLTHHPMLFAPMKKITDEHFIGSRVVKLLQHDISYYAMHTNYDVLGMAELSGKILGLEDACVLEVTNIEKNEGVGRVGNLQKSITLEECCELVKERFDLPSVKLFGDKNLLVKRAAISPGSGKHMTAYALKNQAEVLITGDIDHHEGIDALAQGLAIIDAGHYGLEAIFIKDMADYLEQHLENVEIETAKTTHPFQII
jgi:dinuclear metal center YbgI/SA1388 family protein